MSLSDDLIADFRHRASTLSEPTKGMLWMFGGAVCMTTVITLIKHLNSVSDMHAFEIAFFRNVFSLTLMIPWMLKLPREALKTKRHAMHGLRSIFGLTAMCSWFYSVTIMPLAEAVTLSFTTPLFATILAPIFLHEVVRLRRWSATAIGFIGVIVVLRPGAEAIQPASLVVLGSAFMLAITMMFVKSLARTEATATMMFYTMFWMTPLSLIPALFVWQTPSFEQVLWMALIGAVATGVQGCLAQAFHHADASFLAAFDYSKLPLTAVAGWLVFGETTDVWTWVGAGIIAGSSVYIARREAQIAKAGQETQRPSHSAVTQDAPEGEA
jgi:drug/metabolite transporter (DMT)-like permease